MTWKQALGKAIWRTFLLANTLATFCIFRYAFQKLRQGKVDSMAGLIGKEVLTIWTLSELVMVCFILVWVTRQRHE